MVQFVYAVIGFGICYIIVNSVPAPFSYALAGPIAFLVVCIDFVKVNERPFLYFLRSFLIYLHSPRQRFWKQAEESDFDIEIYHQKKEGATVAHKGITEDEIARVAQRFDTQGTQVSRKAKNQ